MREKKSRNKKIVEFRERGYTQQAIARIFHVRQVTVSHILAREIARKSKEGENVKLDV